MSLRELVYYPDERLRIPAAAVADVTAAEHRLIDDMFETMYAAPGVGLAAPQVGVGRQILVMDPGAEGEHEPLALINPRIAAAEGEITWEEGCLSIPGFMAEVTRANRVTVEATGIEGHPMKLEFEGFPAVVVQHEIDHLNGILFVDYLSRTRWRLFEKEFGKDPYRWKYAARRA